MLDDLLKYPPPTHFQRPERVVCDDGLDALLEKVGDRFRSLAGLPLFRAASILPYVERHAACCSLLPDAELPAEAGRIGMQIRRHGFRPELIGRSFALIRESAGRMLGMRHFDVQLMGGWALLNGMVAEMETGEGKTLTATLAAGTAALAGIPVHLLTVNDYLADRDAGEMGPVYRALGITVGCITHEVPVEQRRNVYLSDVTYCTNKEIVFDYLRDRLTIGDFDATPIRLQAESLYAREARENRLLLRGLYYAIVDEADSILIDESRTPLIISSQTAENDEIGFLQAVLDFARSLERDADFMVDVDSRVITMTGQGSRKADLFETPAGTMRLNSLRRHEMVRRALSGLHLFHRDRDYLVRDGKVQIVDAFTGRVMADRSWEEGLQQLIELKEGCELTRQQQTSARISYQNFFRRYVHLSGMTGTAREVRVELSSVYRLRTVRIPTNRPSGRVRLPSPLFAGVVAKEKHILKRVTEVHASGQPVLIGVASVAAAERISGLLSSTGVQHMVLSAKNDAEEAAVVAEAGQMHAVTIATNMAGRGTDIKLGPGVAEAGGLHVIITELHEAARIDRQLAGRCARQGDPGSYEMILSLEDSILEGGKGGVCELLALRLEKIMPFLWAFLANRAVFGAQKKIEKLHAGMRRDLFRQDRQLRNRMTFIRREG